MSHPLVSLPRTDGTEQSRPLAATGSSFSVLEWRGSGPRSLHIHHAAAEAWHVLEGYLIVLTPRLAALIEELQRTPAGTDYAALYRRYQSTLLE